MKIRKVVYLFLVATGIWIAAVASDFLFAWRPRFGLEAEFQRVIDEAQVADYYRKVGGWDKEDVTDKICHSVDSRILNQLGIPIDDRTRWQFPINGSYAKSQDIWTIFQAKGAIAACRDFSARYLKIEIDRQTLACTATVTVMPNCDL